MSYKRVENFINTNNPAYLDINKIRQANKPQDNEPSLTYQPHQRSNSITNNANQQNDQYISVKQRSQSIPDNYIFGNQPNFLPIPEQYQQNYQIQNNLYNNDYTHLDQIYYQQQQQKYSVLYGVKEIQQQIPAQFQEFNVAELKMEDCNFEKDLFLDDQQQQQSQQIVQQLINGHVNVQEQDQIQTLMDTSYETNRDYIQPIQISSLNQNNIQILQQKNNNLSSLNGSQLESENNNHNLNYNNSIHPMPGKIIVSEYLQQTISTRSGQKEYLRDDFSKMLIDQEQQQQQRPKDMYGEDKENQNIFDQKNNYVVQNQIIIHEEKTANIDQNNIYKQQNNLQQQLSQQQTQQQSQQNSEQSSQKKVKKYFQHQIQTKPSLAQKIQGKLNQKQDDFNKLNDQNLNKLKQQLQNRFLHQQNVNSEINKSININSVINESTNENTNKEHNDHLLQPSAKQSTHNHELIQPLNDLIINQTLDLNLNCSSSIRNNNPLKLNTNSNLIGVNNTNNEKLISTIEFNSETNSQNQNLSQIENLNNTCQQNQNFINQGRFSEEEQTFVFKDYLEQKQIFQVLNTEEILQNVNNIKKSNNDKIINNNNQFQQNSETPQFFIRNNTGLTTESEEKIQDMIQQEMHTQTCDQNSEVNSYISQKRDKQQKQLQTCESSVSTLDQQMGSLQIQDNLLEEQQKQQKSHYKFFQKKQNIDKTSYLQEQMQQSQQFNYLNSGICSNFGHNQQLHNSMIQNEFQENQQNEEDDSDEEEILYKLDKKTGKLIPLKINQQILNYNQKHAQISDNSKNISFIRNQQLNIKNQKLLKSQPQNQNENKENIMMQQIKNRIHQTSFEENEDQQQTKQQNYQKKQKSNNLIYLSAQKEKPQDGSQYQKKHIQQSHSNNKKPNPITFYKNAQPLNQQFQQCNFDKQTQAVCKNLRSKSFNQGGTTLDYSNTWEIVNKIIKASQIENIPFDYIQHTTKEYIEELYKRKCSLSGNNNKQQCNQPEEVCNQKNNSKHLICYLNNHLCKNEQLYDNKNKNGSIYESIINKLNNKAKK